MARPPSQEPRNNQVPIRVTDRQSAILDALAALSRSTPNQVVYEIVSQAIDRRADDALVKEQLALHAKFENRGKAKIVKFSTNKT